MGIAMNLPLAVGLNAALILLCFKLRLLSKSGLAAGFIIGTSIFFCLDWGGWVVLITFFLGGTAATQFQFERKKELGVAQESGGRRRWRHAWANTGTGVACALASFAASSMENAYWANAWKWAFVGCFAAALSDTLSSEFGQLADQKPWLITTGEEVPLGTDGGITRAGILVGILGAILLTLVGRFLSLVPVRATFPILLAGLSGNLFDSYLGATLQKRGLLTNDLVNLSNTVLGALLGLFGYWLMVELPGLLTRWGFGYERVLRFFV